MFDSIKDKFNSASLPIKILMAIGIPLVVVFFIFTKGRDLISGILESSARSSVDKQDAALSARISEVVKKESYEAGKIDQLEEEKQNAIKAVDSDDAVSFHNKRK